MSPKKLKPGYKKNLTNRVKRVQEKVPVQLSKYYLMKAMAKFRKCGRNIKKKQHPVIEKHNIAGERCLHVCVSPSMNATTLHLAPLIQYARTRYFLADVLRKALLKHNWNHGLRLLELITDKPFASKGLLMYYIRVILILLFNIRVPKRKIKRFLDVTLSLRGKDKKIEFLKSIIELKEFGARKKMKEQKSQEKQKLSTKHLKRPIKKEPK